MKHFIIRSIHSQAEQAFWISSICKDGVRMVTPFREEARKFTMATAEELVKEWIKDCPDYLSFAIEGTGIMSPEEQTKLSCSVMSDAQLDSFDMPNDWVSIPNPKQIGTKDQWLVGPIDSPKIKAWRDAHGFSCMPAQDGQPS